MSYKFSEQTKKKCIAANRNIFVNFFVPKYGTPLFSFLNRLLMENGFYNNNNQTKTMTFTWLQVKIGFCRFKFPPPKRKRNFFKPFLSGYISRGDLDLFLHPITFFVTVTLPISSAAFLLLIAPPLYMKNCSWISRILFNCWVRPFWEIWEN